jgi:hypothetical protein
MSLRCDWLIGPSIVQASEFLTSAKQRMTSCALIGDDLRRVVVSKFGKLGVAVPVHHARVVRERGVDKQVVALERV